MEWGCLFHHPDWWRRRRPHIRVILAAGNFAVELIKEDTIHMATSLKVGQTLPLSIDFLDQNGNTILTAPVPDAPPVWSSLDPAIESLTPSADGMTAEVVGLAAGADTVKVDLQVGGVDFTATIDVTVEAVAPAQVLTSIEIVPGTPV